MSPVGAAMTTWSNGGPQREELIQGSSPPLSLVSGSWEYCLASAAKSAPGAFTFSSTAMASALVLFWEASSSAVKLSIICAIFTSAGCTNWNFCFS